MMSRLRFAYNTNGVSNHRFDDALALIADHGYDGVALTLDHHHFDPFAPDLPRRAESLARKLDALNLGLVVETGARFLLDPRRKHEPTLVSPEAEGRKLRVDFLTRAMDIAAACGAEAVSFWAGVKRPEVSAEAAWACLREGLMELAARAEERGVTLAFEPEPGMLVETIDDYRTLRDVTPRLRVALDTGHCLVSGEIEPAAAVREMRNELGTVAIEDMRRGVHEHLAFGEGEMDIAGILRALREIEYDKLICVELSRDSHRAHQMVPRARAYLREIEKSLG